MYVFQRTLKQKLLTRLSLAIVKGINRALLLNWSCDFTELVAKYTVILGVCKEKMYSAFVYLHNAFFVVQSGVNIWRQYC